MIYHGPTASSPIPAVVSSSPGIYKFQIPTPKADPVTCSHTDSSVRWNVTLEMWISKRLVFNRAGVLFLLVLNL